MIQVFSTLIQKAAPFSVVLLFLCAPYFVFAAEQISNYEVEIEINDDSSFFVTETISYDFGAAHKHGIYRNILHRHPQEASAWYKIRSIDISVDSITRNGAAEQFVVTDGKDLTSVKIGSAETFVTGQQVYTIRYHVTGGLSYLSDETVEVYWNVTGNDWQVPIKRVEVVVRPAEILLAANHCYRGSVYDATECAGGILSEEDLRFSTENLGPYEGVTIATEVRPEAVPVVINERVKIVFIIIPIVLAFIGWLVRFIYRFKTHYRPKSQTIIAQYEPYQDVLPMFSGVLMDRRLDGRDVTAGLLYLAKYGFIKIKKIDRKLLGFISLDDYEVTLQKNISSTDDSMLPSKFHRTILELIFVGMNEGETVKLSEIKKSSSRQRKNHTALTKLQSSITDDLVTRGFYERKLGMMRKTKKGYEAIWHLKGFKQFLSVTDKERFKFHNAPQKNPEQFLEYLPYAVAFGVEKEWAEVFKDMEIKTPDWYEGPSSSFSAFNISKEMSSFATAANAASGSGYTSSSSASSGGGFSGGGGGGGGGGSW